MFQCVCFGGSLNLPTVALSFGQHAISLGPALSSQARTSVGFAWFFVILAAAHFLFDAAAFNQFSKSADSFLDGFFVTYQQLYHCLSKRTIKFTFAYLKKRNLQVDQKKPSKRRGAT
jgi:hypothetical protein